MIYEVHMNYYSSFLICVMALYGYRSISVAQPAYIDSVAISHTVSFMTEDSVWVFADLYPAQDRGSDKTNAGYPVATSVGFKQPS